MKLIVATVVLLFASPVTAGVPMSAEFAARFIAFHNDYSAFARLLLACPDNAASFDDCSPALGTIDLRTFAKARKSAAKFFDLEEGSNGR